MNYGKKIFGFWLMGTLAVLLAAQPPAWGQTTSITNATELDAATNNASPRVFNAGDYTITAPGTMIFGAIGVTYQLDAGSTLTITGAALNSALLVNNFTLNGGTLVTKGGAGSFEGFEADQGFTMFGGSLTATGSDSGAGEGFHVDNNGLIQSGGNITAQGGAGKNGNGARIDDRLTQNGGQLTARGGSGELAFGLGLWVSPGAPATNRLTQDALGHITAQAGSGRWAHGLLTDTTAFLNGTLTIEPSAGGQEAHSLMIVNQENAATALTFGSTSVLNVELAGNRSGNILVHQGSVDIQNGAKLFARNTAGLTTRTYDFLEIYQGAGTITGEFDTSGSQTLDFTLVKSLDQQTYSLTVSQIADLGGAAGGADTNGGRALGAIGAAGAPTPALAAVYDYLNNNSANPALSRWAGSLTPQQNAQVISGLKRVTDLLARRSLAALRRQGPGAPAAGEETANGLWLSPFYLNGRQSGQTAEFADLSEEYYGFSLGYGRRSETAGLGLALHYARGDYEAADYDGRDDLFGLTLAGDYRFPGCGSFRPLLSGWLGYSHTGLSQSRLAAPNGVDPRPWLKSSPDLNQWSLGMELANTWAVGPQVSLTPSLGLRYSQISQESYREHGRSGQELTVKAEDYRSLLATAALEAGFALGENADLKIFGAYDYELGDDRSVLRSNFSAAPTVRFETLSQDLSGHQGRLGADLSFNLADGLAANLDYQLQLANHYVGQAAEAGLTWSW